MHRRLALLLIGPCLALAGGALHADEPAPQGAQPEALHLSLVEAARMAAEANLDVLLHAHDAPIAYQRRIAAEGSFDTLLTAGFAVSRTELPVTNLFLGMGVTQEDAVDSHAGLTRRLHGGGRVSLLYRADRLSTNNPFATVNPGWTQGASLEASQPLLRGAGDVALADVRRAQNDLVAARAGYDVQVEATLLAVLEAYANLVFADENLVARLKSEAVARELLADADARVQAGVGTPLDVAEARAGVERRRSEVLAARNARATVEDRLLSLILPFGREARRALRIVPTDPAPDAERRVAGPEDEARYVDLALQGRSELLGLRAEVASRGIDAQVAQDAIRPQLDVLGRAATDGLSGGLGGSFTNAAEGQAVSGSIGLEFSIFLGQRSARASWLAAAWARRQSLLRMREAENQIVVQVRAALRDLDTARGQWGAARAEVEAADEALAGEVLRKDQGKSTPFRVLQKEDDLTAARTRAGRSVADLRIAEGRLWRAVGTLTENLGVAPRRWAACAPGRGGR